MLGGRVNIPGKENNIAVYNIVPIGTNVITLMSQIKGRPDLHLYKVMNLYFSCTTHFEHLS